MCYNSFLPEMYFQEIHPTNLSQNQKQQIQNFFPDNLFEFIVLKFPHIGNFSCNFLNMRQPICKCLPVLSLLYFSEPGMWMNIQHYAA